jgi:hypothetical protein
MATCYINEYQGIAVVPAPGLSGGTVTMQAPSGFIVANNVAIGSEAKSNAFNARTYLIEIAPDAICSVLIGDNPTATTGNMRIAANERVYYPVSPGQKISVISNT